MIRLRLGHYIVLTKYAGMQALASNAQGYFKPEATLFCGNMATMNEIRTKTEASNLDGYIIWGAKGHGKVCRSIVDREYGLELVALFDNNETLISLYQDVILHRGRIIDSWLSDKRNHRFGFIVAIGGDGGEARVQLSESLELKGLTPLFAIDSRSIIDDDVTIGKGSQIFGGAQVSTGSIIGEYSLINHNANVDHDCIIGKGVHIGPGATMAGEITVEDYAFIAAGATVLPSMHIGQSSVIGAGAVVTKNVPPNTVVVGNPARFMRTI
ncbi:MAG: acetyltransferase [Candidatus Cloacimonetes bacterium]|nr:acetyltransferase [Candidatus Cloacimonadota bacterium]MDY0230474.1 acetyltransferase [Candidatus Cloacimonadaceae bacterium]